MFDELEGLTQGSYVHITILGTMLSSCVFLVSNSEVTTSVRPIVRTS